MTQTTFRYRAYPTEEQAAEASRWMELCRRLYNKAIVDRKEYYQRTGKGLNYENQQNALPAFKDAYPEFLSVHSQVAPECPQKGRECL